MYVQVTPNFQYSWCSRISGAEAIPYPTGNPNLTPEKELIRRREIVEDSIGKIIKITGGKKMDYGILSLAPAIMHWHWHLQQRMRCFLY